MVDTRPTSRTSPDGLPPEITGERPTPGLTPGFAPGRAEPTAPRPRQRIPTLRQLAALVVDGMLVLPRNYRRGMYLDILV